MNFSLYFIVTLIFGFFSYGLNWNSLCNIDPNCSVDVLNTSNKLLFTLSIVLSSLSFISILKTKENTVFYPIIFLIIALGFIVLSIINLVYGKHIKNTPTTTTPPTTTPQTTIKPDENIYIECVSNITSVLNLLIGIIIAMLTIYYLKNEIFNFSYI